MRIFSLGVLIGLIVMFGVSWGVCYLLRRKTVVISAVKAEVNKVESEVKAEVKKI